MPFPLIFRAFDCSRFAVCTLFHDLRLHALRQFFAALRAFDFAAILFIFFHA